MTYIVSGGALNSSNSLRSYGRGQSPSGAERRSGGRGQEDEA